MAASAPLPKSAFFRFERKETSSQGGNCSAFRPSLPMMDECPTLAAAGTQSDGESSASDLHPLSLIPNAPGSGFSHRSGTATASTLHHPAISRVLKVDKLHEPYVSRREKKFMALQKQQQQQQQGSAPSLPPVDENLAGGDAPPAPPSAPPKVINVPTVTQASEPLRTSLAPSRDSSLMDEESMRCAPGSAVWVTWVTWVCCVGHVGRPEDALSIT